MVIKTCERLHSVLHKIAGEDQLCAWEELRLEEGHSQWGCHKCRSLGRSVGVDQDLYASQTHNKRPAHFPHQVQRRCQDVYLIKEDTARVLSDTSRAASE